MIATFTKSRTFASRFTSRGFESRPVLCVDSIFHIVGMRSVKRRKPKGKSNARNRWAQYVSRTATSSWQRTHIINY